MAITLANADKALKSIYLDAVTEQLDKSINPFYAAIEKSTSYVTGKDVRVVTSFGVNGGIGAGEEDGDLPSAKGNQYAEFRLPLKNLYGVIQISDKAIRASENNAGAFVNLLNAEMDGLVKSSKYNFGRMLFGNGTGRLGNVLQIVEEKIYVDNIQNFYVGLVVDVYRDPKIVTRQNARISSVNFKSGYIKMEGDDVSSIASDCYFVIQGSLDNEITGLGALFDTNATTLYGVDRAANEWVNPYSRAVDGHVSEVMIQTALDDIERQSGSSVNIIICSLGIRRKLQQLFSQNRMSLDTVELAGGYKAMSYNGIPIIADRFCPAGTIYMLNTNDFCMHQLCDWQWLSGEDGKVLQQVAGKPVYTATLVKYAELICSRPNGQGVLYDIMED